MASVAGGGKFKNGAFNGAFAYLITPSGGGRAWNETEEQEGLSEAEKSAKYKRDLKAINEGLDAIRNTTDLNIPCRVITVDASDNDGNLAGVKCALFECDPGVYVSKQYLQTERDPSVILLTAYHETLHFNDLLITNYTIDNLSSYRHTEIYRLEDQLSWGALPGTRERKVYEEFMRLQHR